MLEANVDFPDPGIPTRTITTRRRCGGAATVRTICGARDAGARAATDDHEDEKEGEFAESGRISAPRVKKQNTARTS